MVAAQRSVVSLSIRVHGHHGNSVCSHCDPGWRDGGKGDPACVERPWRGAQQIPAVVLAYFAITTSFIPVGIAQFIKNRPAVQKASAPQSQSPAAAAPAPPRNVGATLAGAVFALVIIAAAEPFLALRSGSVG
jgi:hypothetical protein